MGSFGKNADQRFSDQVRFLKGLLKTYTIDPKKAQLGIVTFGKSQDVALKFNVAKDRDSAYSLIDKVKNPNDGDDIVGALRFIRQSLFVAANGVRPGANKVLFVFLDRKLGDLKAAVNEEIRLIKERGVTVLQFVLGKDVPKDEIDDIIDVWFFPDPLAEIDPDVIVAVRDKSRPSKYIFILKRDRFGDNVIF